MTDAASLSGNAKGKSLEKINHDIDSLNQLYDSIGRIYLNEANVRFYGGVQRINKMIHSKKSRRAKNSISTPYIISCHRTRNSWR